MLEALAQCYFRDARSYARDESHRNSLIHARRVTHSSDHGELLDAQQAGLRGGLRGMALHAYNTAPPSAGRERTEHLPETP